MKGVLGIIRYQVLVVLTLAIVVIYGHLTPIKGQQLPNEAALPAGKGSWVVDQNFKTSIGGTYIRGYIRVLVQSDGTVFHRKFFDTMQPATPWCEVKFSASEMRGIRGAVARSNPAAWQPKYGQWISVFAPFRILVITIRGAKDQIIEHQTELYRFDTCQPTYRQ